MIEEYLAASEVAIRQLDQASINSAAGLTERAIRDGHRLFLCGNGGSAADAGHLAGEFIGRFALQRNALPAIALDAGPGLTAIANDFGYEHVFARPLRGLGAAGDVLWAFSTSGQSRNIILAAEAARQLGMKIVAFLGQRADSPLYDVADVVIRAGNTTPLAQQAHMVAGHLICALVEAKLHG